MRLARLALFCSITLMGSSCSPVATLGEQKYSITKMGLQEVEGRKAWDYNNSVTFTATQVYKIKNESGLTERHWLAMRITKRSGQTVLEDTADWLELVEGGEFEFDCSHYVSISPNEEKDFAPITCDFEMVGVTRFDANAVHISPETETPPTPE